MVYLYLIISLCYTPLVPGPLCSLMYNYLVIIWIKRDGFRCCRPNNVVMIISFVKI